MFSNLRAAERNLKKRGFRRNKRCKVVIGLDRICLLKPWHRLFVSFPISSSEHEFVTLTISKTCGMVTTSQENKGPDQKLKMEKNRRRKTNTHTHRHRPLYFSFKTLGHACVHREQPRQACASLTHWPESSASPSSSPPRPPDAACAPSPPAASSPPPRASCAPPPASGAGPAPPSPERQRRRPHQWQSAAEH